MAPDPHRSEAEALAGAALNDFVLGDNAKARRKLEKALALDPANKKAIELQKILASAK